MTYDEVIALKNALRAGLPVVAKEVDLERMILRIDNGKYHMLPVSEIDDVDEHRAIVDLMRRKFVKLLPDNGRFPERYALTGEGLDAMETFTASVVARVVARYKAARDDLVNPEVVKLIERIQGIPGWERSNFLRSIYDQVRRRGTLSPKQLDVLDKIEKDQGGRGGRPALPEGPAHGAIPFGLKQYGHEKKEVEAVLNALRSHGLAKVYDPKGILTSNAQLQKHIISELATDFWGMAESYAERNADEDDPEKHDYNSIVRTAAEGAAHDMEKAKLVVKDGVVTTQPSYQAIARKHSLNLR